MPDALKPDTLRKSAVHVWRSTTGAFRPDDFLVLSPEERERAERFRFEEHSNAYAHSHAMMRRVLSRYVGIAPHDLRFTQGPYGKRSLRDSEIRFNLSHSSNLVVVAVASCEVGVDVEYMRDDVDFLEIAKSFFSPREYALVARAGAAIRQTFYRIWTCKEAYMKARGMGFSLPPQAFDVCGESGPGVLNAEDQTGWSLSEIHCADEYAAALAAEGATRELEIRDYSETGRV